jgi:endonuclease III
MFPRQFRNLRPFTITREIADQMIEKIDGLNIFLEYVNDPLVIAEIMSFRQARAVDPRTLARNVLIFAMLSPQTRFDKNMAAFRNAVAIWDTDPDVDTLTNAIREVGFAPTKALRLTEARDFLNDPLLHEKMTTKNVLALKGMGHKTTAFALALFDDMSPVFTLDVHMLRALCHATGFGADVNPLINDSAYVMLSKAWVDWTRQNGVESPFVAQWSLWNVWGFNRHVSHVGILEGIL